MRGWLKAYPLLKALAHSLLAEFVRVYRAPPSLVFEPVHSIKVT